MTLLEIKDLKMYYETKKGLFRAVDGVSFSLNHGETYGIVGESGCGKTSIANTILRVLPLNGRIVSGEVLLEGVDLLKMTESELRKIRWNEISLIFQGAMNALNPLIRIEDQLIEPLIIHENLTKGEAKEKIENVCKLVGLDPSRITNYPHEFSGGMKQRAIIAMSLICNPKIVIADEPTTALDVVVQDQILEKIKDIQETLNLAMIYISHDLSVIAEISDKIAIMYAGKIVESGNTVSIFTDPHHPYTMNLLYAIPSIRGPIKKLKSISGPLPDLHQSIQGCMYQSRCPFAENICKKESPPRTQIEKNHFSLCHFAHDPKIKDL